MIVPRLRDRPGLALLCAGLLLAGCGTAGSAAHRPRSTAPGAIASGLAVDATGSTHVSPAGSFIALATACACSGRTVIERFALTDGRPLGALARVTASSASTVANPHADRSGKVWITVDSGPRCTSGIAGCGPERDSCSGQTVRLDPRTGAIATELVSPRSVLVTGVLPSPSGRLVATVTGGCATSFFDQHIVVRDLRSGRSWSVGSDAAPCHALGDPAWSPDGRQLVFPYGPSVLSRHAHVVGGTCQAARFSRLVVVSARRASSSTAWTLIRADHGCSYQAATFDRWGIAAIEGCVQGGPRGQYSVDSGDAYLVQLDTRHRVTLRLKLAPGYDAGDIASDPHTGTVLVSEYQSANQGTPVYDWVWAFDGHALRVVHRYRNEDTPTVVAEPW